MDPHLFNALTIPIGLLPVYIVSPTAWLGVLFTGLFFRHTVPDFPIYGYLVLSDVIWIMAYLLRRVTNRDS